jgi:N-glycosylase/DNA lyase
VKLTEIAASDFDLEKTLNSGQVFHWEKIENGFIGSIGDRAVYVEQRGDVLKVRDGEPPSPVGQRPALPRIVAGYFALDHPLSQICRSFPKDQAMKAARSFCAGLRILRQPKWECLATFICSSMKQVAHIRQISHALRSGFGQPCKIDTHTLHTFPSAERIAESSEKELRECALGYRAKNLLATARLVRAHEADLEGWAALSDVDLRDKLCALPGVGAKVANCVMLFAYERLRAFPIDVWIERVLKEKYFPRARKLNASRLQAFTQEYFGEHGGYAQQYLFHHARMSNKLEGRAPSRAKIMGRHKGRPSMTKRHR